MVGLQAFQLDLAQTYSIAVAYDRVFYSNTMPPLAPKATAPAAATSGFWGILGNTLLSFGTSASASWKVCGAARRARRVACVACGRGAARARAGAAASAAEGLLWRAPAGLVLSIRLSPHLLPHPAPLDRPRGARQYILPFFSGPAVDGIAAIFRLTQRMIIPLVRGAAGA